LPIYKGTKLQIGGKENETGTSDESFLCEEELQVQCLHHPDCQEGEGIPGQEQPGCQRHNL
jgi:hypothetical protein